MANDTRKHSAIALSSMAKAWRWASQVALSTTSSNRSRAGGSAGGSEGVHASKAKVCGGVGSVAARGSGGYRALIVSIWTSLRREPLVPFLLMGGILWGVYAFARTEPKPTLTVRRAAFAALLRQEVEMTGRPADAGRREALLDQLVDDEVLLAEARRRGFDEADFRVRKRLLTVMRTSLTESVAVPGRAKLKAYYAANRERLRAGPSVDFEHVFFAPGSPSLPADPDAFRKSLAAGSAPADLGDEASMGPLMRRVERDELARIAGGVFADAVHGLESSDWSGPLKSALGVHYVRVVARHPAGLASFDKIESYLRDEWMLEEARRRQQERIAVLREKYTVEVVD
jgi:peptidyl-prolyl cis-trans isomerase C